MPAPSTIKISPRTSALHACHRQREVILPRITSTFQVAPEAGWARRRGPNEVFRLIPGIGVIVLYSVWGVALLEEAAAVALVMGHAAAPGVDGVWFGWDDGELADAPLESVITWAVLLMLFLCESLASVLVVSALHGVGVSCGAPEELSPGQSLFVIPFPSLALGSLWCFVLNKALNSGKQRREVRDKQRS